MGSGRCLPCTVVRRSLLYLAGMTCLSMKMGVIATGEDRQCFCHTTLLSREGGWHRHRTCAILFPHEGSIAVEATGKDSQGSYAGFDICNST